MPATLNSQAAQVQEIFTLLFGGETQVQASRDPFPAADVAAVAEYVDANDSVRRLIACDHAFANGSGAALSMIPPGVVNQAVKARTVDSNIADNFREVMNICANLLQPEDAEQYRLRSVKMGADVKGMLPATAPTGAQFKVTIARYPAGRFQILDAQA